MTRSTGHGPDREPGGRGRMPLAERLRRRSLAPGRPLVHADQAGLVVFTIAALGAGTYVVVRHLL